MLRALARDAARRLPPLRRLIDSRDAALAELERLRAPGGAAEGGAERAAALAMQERRRALDAMLAAAAPGSFFGVMLNGVPVELPVETLRTMVHCLHPGDDRSVQAWVETQHLDWMLERLAGGGTFLDIGAATGATTLPVVRRLGTQVRVIAYEPALAARDLLARTLARNGIADVDLRPVAVADRAGEAEFLELLPDDSGRTPWQPETSSLASAPPPGLPFRRHRVRVVTLDEDALPDCRGKVVAKIDVEGFEAQVLRGAARLLAERRPDLAIDIHADPEAGDGRLTEPAVRAILEPLGYGCTRRGHVLLCAG
jgi:FkbM family methyltransferase